MILLWALLIIIILLSVVSETVSQKKTILTNGNPIILTNKSLGSIFFAFLVFLILSLFAGFRTSFNDTGAYLSTFKYKIPEIISKIDLSQVENPGFYLYQVLIKQFISTDPQTFLIISALITYLLIISFYFKYSKYFTFTIFLFITSGLFIFGMAAMKQMLAMSIGLYAIHHLIKKNKITFMVLIIFASTIHPYILLYGFVPFIKKRVWSTKMYLVLIFAIIIGFIFEKMLFIMLNVTDLLGREYGIETLTGEGLNIFRILVYSVVPILSFIYRHKINNQENEIIKIGVNMSVIAFAFSLMGAFGNANMFGRMAIYFIPLTYLVLPWLLIKCISKKYRLLMIVLCIIFYCIYFYYQYALVQTFEYKSIFN